jgi:hypothetical protein
MSSIKILPLAITMVAGPQILSAVLLLTSRRGKASTAAFVAGAAVASTLGTAIFYLLAGTLSLGGGSNAGKTVGKLIQTALILFLVWLTLMSFRHRHEVQPLPGWMTRLQQTTPPKAVLLGLLLFMLMPTDLAAMATVGTNLRTEGESFIAALPFLLLTVLLVGSPLLAYLLLGHRGEPFMAGVRRWMESHSWVINMLVYIIFIALIWS